MNLLKRRTGFFPFIPASVLSVSVILGLLLPGFLNSRHLAFLAAASGTVLTLNIPDVPESFRKAVLGLHLLISSAILILSGLTGPCASLVMMSLSLLWPPLAMRLKLTSALMEGNGAEALTVRGYAESNVAVMSESVWPALSLLSLSLCTIRGGYDPVTVPAIGLQCLAFGLIFIRRVLNDRNVGADLEQVEDSGPVVVPSKAVCSPRLFQRVEEHMLNEQPFLSPVFSLEGLSRDIFSNSGYVSKAVNSCAGMNFSQYVNSYRVKYSMLLYASDTRLRVMDLALMSGFNSKVTYNIAFKLLNGLTPGEWCKSYLENPEILYALPGVRELGEHLDLSLLHRMDETDHPGV